MLQLQCKLIKYKRLIFPLILRALKSRKLKIIFLIALTHSLNQGKVVHPLGKSVSLKLMQNLLIFFFQIEDKIYMYDPVLTNLERFIIERLNIHLIPRNEVSSCYSFLSF